MGFSLSSPISAQLRFSYSFFLVYTLLSLPLFATDRLLFGEVVLLSHGKFSRSALVAVTAVLLFALLLVLDIEFVRSVVLGLFAANSLDFAMVALAALCSFLAARRTSGYARQLWTLLGAALAIQSLAQAISTYYQSFVPGAWLHPWPSDILFFVWAAPVLMIFLPPSEEQSSAIYSLQLIDFFQISIVAVTVYLYFFYSPSRWFSQPISLLHQILILYIVRDLLISIGFFFRSRASLPSWLRSFSFVLALVFLGAVLSDADYLFTLGPSQETANWADLVYMVPYALVTLFAVTWKQPESAPLPAPSTRAGRFLASQIFPLGMPLVVIFMARAIAREHVILAWLAVTASVLCSSFSLLLTNRNQRRISENLLAAEKALRSSEQMLSTAFRSSPDSFSINVFPDGPYLEINGGFTRLTGYTREETIGKAPSQMALWVDPSERARVLARITQTGDVRDAEFRFRNKAGQLRVGLMSASLIELDSRTCALVVVRDITARKEAEDILRTSEERFRSLVQNLHVGIVTYGPDARILYCNQALLDVFGRTLDQVIGHTTAELDILALGEDGAPNPDSQRLVPTVIASRQPLRSQLVGWRISGRPDPIWTLLDVVPEYSSTGELLRVVVSVTDLTEQRRAIEALRESEERFRTLVNDLHAAVVLHRPDGRIEYANPAAYRMFGVPDGTAVGKLPEDYGVVPVTENGRDIPPDERPVSTVLRNRTAVQTGVLGLRYPGSPDRIIWVFGNVVPQFDAHGNVIRVITSFSDISEMKNAERAIHRLSTQLLQLQDEERRRLGRELHDGLAQTVLAINLSLAQIRQSLHSDEHPALRALEKARSLTQQMSREIRTLSYLLHPPLLDDLGLVSALKEYAQGFGERSGIDTQLYILSEFDRLPQPVELALFRVVQESLANIQRHSGSATAKIRLRQEDSRITLEVVDSGRGMKTPAVGSLQPKEARLGVGIPGMRERMAQLGGRLDIVSGPAGTTVRAAISLSDVMLDNDGASVGGRSFSPPWSANGSDKEAT